jgi:hypothetical protein
VTLTSNATTARRLHLALAVGLLLTIFGGFWPSYFGPLLQGTGVQRPSVVHAHVVVFALWVGSRVQAQFLTLEQPTVVAGPDVGFRVERVDRGIPLGRLVVKVDGKWIDAQFAGGAVRVAQ